MLKYKITRTDVFLICSMLFLAVISFLILLSFEKDKGQFFEVRFFTQNETRTERYSLNIDCDYVFTNNGYTLTVSVSNKTVFVSESNCENQICVHSKPIYKQGTSIICAPAGIEIKIVTDKEDTYADDVAG